MGEEIFCSTSVVCFSIDDCLFVFAGFLFLYHLHGRSMLDVHVHQLLLYAVFGEALVAFLEVFHRGNILLELLRCTFTLLQGSWFWQVNMNVCMYEQKFVVMLKGAVTDSRER